MGVSRGAPCHHGGVCLRRVRHIPVKSITEKQDIVETSYLQIISVEQIILIRSITTNVNEE